MNKKTLNITNGEYFNEFFLSKFNGEAVPFCEAMMDGKTLPDIYSEDFIKLRASELNVSIEEYKAKMTVYDALCKNSYSELCLWFGKDTFCVANLLTLLAYLEQIEFSGKVTLNYIDDETFEVSETGIDIKLGFYKKLYTDILILKNKPNELGVFSKRAIDLYFDYHSQEGMLANLIKKNSDKNKTELICLLIENSKEYGLSDLQAEKLIASVLSNLI